MQKNQLKKFKKILEAEKSRLEEELEEFAKKDRIIKGKWNTKYPSASNKGPGDEMLEEAADEVEAYSNALPLEYNLESLLRDVNLALNKIKESNYGKCEKCGKNIPIARLEANPEAKTCKAN